MRINQVTSALLFTWKSKQKAPIISLINNKRMHHLVIIELRVLNAIKLIISRQSLCQTRAQKMPSKRMKYSAKFKLQVVKFAEDSNNCAASREFCVNEKLVQDWRRQVEKLKCMPKSKCANRGKKCQWPELEDSIRKWIEQQRQSGYIVTRNLIRIKAKAMASDRRITDFQVTNS